MSKGISGLTKRELLARPINQFELSLRDLPFEHCFEQLFDELSAHGILFRPHFWFSDDWFSPSGIPGVGMPFYLAHPRLLQLYRQYVGLAEGTGERSFMKLLRHETGHAFEHAYKLESNSLKEKAFGSSKAKYPKSYTYKPYSRAYVKHLGEGYAQSHPDEDFAETFAVWLDPQSDWRVKYKNWQALIKLKTVDFLARRVSKRTPLCNNKRSHDGISKIKQSFGDFLNQKAKERNSLAFIDRDLMSFCHSQSQSYKESTKLLMSQKSLLVGSVAEAIGTRKYKIESIYNEYIKRQKKYKLHFSGSERQKQRLLLDLLTEHSIKSLAENKDRVIM